MLVCAESATICKRRLRRAVRRGSRHPCSGLFCHCFPVDSGERRHCSLCVAQNRGSLGQIARFHAWAARAPLFRRLYFHCCLQWRLPVCCIAEWTPTPRGLADFTVAPFPHYYQGCLPCALGAELTGIYRNLQTLSCCNAARTRAGRLVERALISHLPDLDIIAAPLSLLDA